MKETVKQARPSWMIIAVALTGIGINVLYFGGGFAMLDDPLSHFQQSPAAHIAILSLMGVFPLLAVFANRVLVDNHLSARSSQIDEELAARNRELAELKSFTENIIACVNDLIFVISPDGRFQFVSGNSLSVMGYEAEELMGRQLIDVVAPGAVATAVRNFERIMWGKDVPAYELEIANGEDIRCIEISSTAYQENGRVIAQVGVARGVSERKQLERHISENSKLCQDLNTKTDELERQNQDLSLAAEQIADLIDAAEQSRSFSVRYENPNLARCWEVKDCRYVDCPSHQSANLRCWQVAGTHCGGEVQGVVAQKLGACEQCDVYRMARTDRIAAMGEMFNNMMAMLEQKAEQEQRLQEQLVQSARMVRNLRDYPRPGELQQKEVS